MYFDVLPKAVLHICGMFALVHILVTPLLFGITLLLLCCAAEASPNEKNSNGKSGNHSLRESSFQAEVNK